MSGAQQNDMDASQQASNTNFTPNIISNAQSSLPPMGNVYPIGNPSTSQSENPSMNPVYFTNSSRVQRYGSAFPVASRYSAGHQNGSGFSQSFGNSASEHRPQPTPVQLYTETGDLRRQPESFAMPNFRQGPSDLLRSGPQPPSTPSHRGQFFPQSGNPRQESERLALQNSPSQLHISSELTSTPRTASKRPASSFEPEDEEEVGEDEDEDVEDEEENQIQDWEIPDPSIFEYRGDITDREAFLEAKYCRPNRRHPMNEDSPAEISKMRKLALQVYNAFQQTDVVCDGASEGKEAEAVLKMKNRYWSKDLIWRVSWKVVVYCHDAQLGAIVGETVYATVISGNPDLPARRVEKKSFFTKEYPSFEARFKQLHRLLSLSKATCKNWLDGQYCDWHSRIAAAPEHILKGKAAQWLNNQYRAKAPGKKSKRQKTLAAPAVESSRTVAAGFGPRTRQAARSMVTQGRTTHQGLGNSNSGPGMIRTPGTAPTFPATPQNNGGLNHQRERIETTHRGFKSNNNPSRASSAAGNMGVQGSGKDKEAAISYHSSPIPSSPVVMASRYQHTDAQSPQTQQLRTSGTLPGSLYPDPARVSNPNYHTELIEFSGFRFTLAYWDAFARRLPEPEARERALARALALTTPVAAEPEPAVPDHVVLSDEVNVRMSNTFPGIAFPDSERTSDPGYFTELIEFGDYVLPLSEWDDIINVGHGDNNRTESTELPVAGESGTQIQEQVIQPRNDHSGLEGSGRELALCSGPMVGGDEQDSSLDDSAIGIPAAVQETEVPQENIQADQGYESYIDLLGGIEEF